MSLCVIIVCNEDIFLIQKLIEEVNNNLNVVKATNRPKLYEELEDIQSRYVRKKLYHVALSSIIVSL